jgi:hypothetical protein
MKVIKQTQSGVGYLFGLLKEKQKVITRAAFWSIPHTSDKNEVCLKIGRYNKAAGFTPETLDVETPKSELTLDNEELDALLQFISQNYEPFKAGVRKYIPLDEKFDEKNIEHVKAIFLNPDKEKLLDLILKNEILPQDLLAGLEKRVQLEAVTEFEEMLANDLVEQKWQEWFAKNQWVLGSDIVEILDERQIDTANITDYLVEAHDGFLDIIEIKRPEGDLSFWATALDHGNYIPSTGLIKAVTQAVKYIYEIEREANSVKFLERVGIKTVKPRCVLIFGRSNDWGDEQKEAYRILNASYHNLSIITYDHVLERAKRILGIKTIPQAGSSEGTNSENPPF